MTSCCGPLSRRGAGSVFHHRGCWSGEPFTLGRLEESAAATEGILEITRTAANATIESAAVMDPAFCIPEDDGDIARKRWSSISGHQVLPTAGQQRFPTAGQALTRRGRVPCGLIPLEHLHIAGYRAVLC